MDLVRTPRRVLQLCSWGGGAAAARVQGTEQVNVRDKDLN